MASKPDFIIAGAAKSGTTALNAWLAAHPGVLMADPKEPSHFVTGVRPFAGRYDKYYYQNFKTEWADYQALFADAGERVCGEASPIYMLDLQSPQLIAARLPDVKIIMVLREPVARAFSQFSHHVRDGLETTTDFAEALEATCERRKAGWSFFHDYVTGGLYEAQIRRFLTHFPQSRILVLLHEDLEHAPRAAWRRICEFIGVEAIDYVDFAQRHNESGGRSLLGNGRLARAFASSGGSIGKTVLSPPIRQAISNGARRLKLTPAPILNPDLAARLGDYYRPHNAALAEMMDLDLSAWNEHRRAA